MGASKNDAKHPAGNKYAADKIIADLYRSGDKESKKHKTRVGASIAKFDAQINHYTNSIKRLSGGVDEVIHGLKGFVAGLAGGAMFVSLIEGSMHLAKSYQKMTDIGQTFGGSMLEMARSAGEAGLPLDEFAAMLKRNSTVAAVLADSNTQTGRSLGSLQKSVRDSLRPMGFYGMSIGQLADLTGDYAETLRLQNSSTFRNKDATSKSVAQFAKDISDFSAVTGKSRDDIAKATNAALQDVSLVNSHLTDAQTKALTTATAFMASIPGETGAMLAKGLAQTVGLGLVWMTDVGKELASVGATGIMSAMQDAADKIKTGKFDAKDEGEYYDRIKKAANENTDTLKILASQGNAGAKLVLEMAQQMNSISREDWVKKQESMKGFTALMSSLEEALSTVTGAFREAFYGALQGVEGSVGNIAPVVEKLKLVATRLGAAFGSLVASAFSPKNIKAAGDFIDKFIDKLPDAATAVKNFLQGFIDFATDDLPSIVDNLKTLGHWIGVTADVIAKIVDFIHGFWSGVITPEKGEDGKDKPNHKADFLTGLTVIAGGLLVKSLIGSLLGAGKSFLGNLLGMSARKVNIKAQVVNVNGGSGGSGGGGGEDDNRRETPEEKERKKKQEEERRRTGGQREEKGPRRTGRQRVGDHIGRNKGKYGAALLGVGGIAALVASSSSAHAAEVRDEGEYYDRIKKDVNEHADTLKILASQGDADAKLTLEMASQMNGISREGWVKKQGLADKEKRPDDEKDDNDRDDDDNGGNADEGEPARPAGVGDVLDKVEDLGGLVMAGASVFPLAKAATTAIVGTVKKVSGMGTAANDAAAKTANAADKTAEMVDATSARVAGAADATAKTTTEAVGSASDIAKATAKTTADATGKAAEMADATSARVAGAADATTKTTTEAVGSASDIAKATAKTTTDATGKAAEMADATSARVAGAADATLKTATDATGKTAEIAGNATDASKVIKVPEAATLKAAPLAEDVIKDVTQKGILKSVARGTAEAAAKAAAKTTAKFIPGVNIAMLAVSAKERYSSGDKVGASIDTASAAMDAAAIALAASVIGAPAAPILEGLADGMQFLMMGYDALGFGQGGDKKEDKPTEATPEPAPEPAIPVDYKKQEEQQAAFDKDHANKFVPEERGINEQLADQSSNKGNFIELAKLHNKNLREVQQKQLDADLSSNSPTVRLLAEILDSLKQQTGIAVQTAAQAADQQEKSLRLQKEAKDLM